MEIRTLNTTIWRTQNIGNQIRLICEGIYLTELSSELTSSKMPRRWESERVRDTVVRFWYDGEVRNVVVKWVIQRRNRDWSEKFTARVMGEVAEMRSDMAATWERWWLSEWRNFCGEVRDGCITRLL